MAELRPIALTASGTDAELDRLVILGRLARGSRGSLARFRPIKRKGRSLSGAVVEDREDRFWSCTSGSTTVRTLLDTHAVATSRVSEVEVASALARRSREGTLSRRDLDRALTALRGDIGVIAVVELATDITQAAIGLVTRHPLRTGDSIQLASCLYLKGQMSEEVGLLAYDERLNSAARAEGLIVV